MPDAELLFIPPLMLPELLDPEFDFPQAVSSSAAATAVLKSAFWFHFIFLRSLSHPPDWAEAFGESVPICQWKYAAVTSTG